MTGITVGSPLDVAEPPAGYRERLQVSHADRRLMEPATVRDGPHTVLADGRQTGKTHHAMEWALDAPPGVVRVLIVDTVSMARERRAGHGLRHDDRRVIHASAAGTHIRRLINKGHTVEVGVDEAVRILERALGIPTPHLLTVCTAAPWQGTDDV